MFLKKISLVNFKNYENAEIDFSESVNCFTGNNGEGKTNLLDAVYYLAFCKSYFNPIDSQNIKHDAPFFVIQGVLSLNNEEEELYCAQKKNQKKQFKRNKKEYARLADHIGFLPLVMISPYDSELINGNSENRRKFIDSVISQFDNKYLDDLISYNRVLSQRNVLLKQFSRSGKFDNAALELWDAQLVAYGMRIYDTRKEFIKEFVPIFQHYYNLIAQGKEVVGLEYDSQLNDTHYRTLLQDSLSKDVRMEYTTAGIHRDDLEFTIRGFSVKKFASQGQQKSFLVALKFAQYDFIKKIKKSPPLLLLDDIYDKLDDERVTALMQLVNNGEFGQLFITDTHPDRLATIFNKTGINYKLFTVRKGRVTTEAAKT